MPDVLSQFFQHTFFRAMLVSLWCATHDAQQIDVIDEVCNLLDMGESILVTSSDDPVNSACFARMEVSLALRVLRWREEERDEGSVLQRPMKFVHAAFSSGL